MSITLVQFSASQTTATTSSASMTITPTLPAAANSSNLALLVAYNDAGGLTGAAIATPSGWTAGPTCPSSSGQTVISTFYTTGFSAASQGVVLSATGGTYYGAAALMEWSGVNNASPFNISTTQNSAAITTTPQTISASSATPTIGTGIGVEFWGWNDNNDDSAGGTTQSGWVRDIEKLGVDSNFASIFVGHTSASPASGVAMTPTLNIPGTSYVSPLFLSITAVLAPATAALIAQFNSNGGVNLNDGGVNQ